MHNNDLAEALNHYYQVGCKTFTRHELLAYGGMNWDRVQKSLRAWEDRGLLRILKPLEGSGDSETVVKLLRLIEEPPRTNLSHLN